MFDTIGYVKDIERLSTENNKLRARIKELEEAREINEKNFEIVSKQIFRLLNEATHLRELLGSIARDIPESELRIALKMIDIHLNATRIRKGEND